MAKTKSKAQEQASIQIKNKKAYHNFELVEKVQAGIVLKGTEVKSLRNRGGDLDGAYARIDDNECWLVGCKISPYAKAGQNNHDPERRRKLLLHKQQIKKITVKLEQKGFTLVPLRIYFNERGIAKIEIALARGKRQYDKRKKLQSDQQKREVDRTMKKYRR